MTDSGNSSGSSTAGDDEFDSRAGSSSISAFLNNHASDSSLHSLPPRHPPPQLHRLHPSPMFDPLSNFFDPLTRSSDPNPIRNLDMAVDWAKSHPRPPEPRSCTGDLTGFGIPQMQLQPLSDGGALSAPDTSNSKQVCPSSASDQASGAVSNSNTNCNAPRNPKKRSRASRRAPTTVLSTDTANFRAMVQEFTGIPDGPFAASPFQRTRLDLFGSASGPPSYLLRPSVYPNTRLTREPNGPLVPPFNISPPPPLSSNANASTPNNYPTLFGTLASSPNATRSLLSPNAQNPILDLQALFQSPNKSLEPDYSKPGVLEEFGLGQATTVNTQLRAGLRDVDPTNNWGNEPAGPNNHGGINIFRSIEVNNLSNSPSPQAGNIPGPKTGCSGPPPSASEFNGDRPGTENNNNNSGSKGEENSPYQVVSPRAGIDPVSPTGHLSTRDTRPSMRSAASFPFHCSGPVLFHQPISTGKSSRRSVRTR